MSEDSQHNQEKNEHFEVITKSLNCLKNEEFLANADIFTGCSSMCLTEKDEDTAGKSMEQQIELIVQQKKSLKPSKLK